MLISCHSELKTFRNLKRGDLKASEEHMRLFRGQVPEVKTLVGGLEHKIDVMNHTIFDMDISTREKVTRSYDDLTRKYTMAALEIQGVNSKHSQLQHEIISLNNKFRTLQESEKSNDPNEEMKAQIDDLYYYFDKLNDTTIRLLDDINETMLYIENVDSRTSDLDNKISLEVVKQEWINTLMAERVNFHSK